MPEPTTTQIRDLSPPGEMLEEVLEERGMTGAELARRTGLSQKHLSQLINAHVPLSMDVALQLERVLGIPARLWNSMEFNYRAERKREEQRRNLANFADWMRRFPLPAMRKTGYFGDAKVSQAVAPRVEALLQFFGVATPEAWEAEWSHATGRFRKSPSFDPDRYALTAWLRRGELESQTIRCAPFDAARFRAAIEEARALTAEPPDRFIPQLQSLCADAGVALTFVPALPKLAISGVTRWKGADKALVSLSQRYKSDDQLWFSFFHEACHVLEHKTGTIYIDSPADPDGDPAERRANQFARDTLIPPAAFAQFTATNRFSKPSIRAFAKKIGVAPGIVVGRLQHERLLQHNQCNNLKRYSD
jgi:HTH-type transcriptional regulator / antitoxin HigA